jgi:HNH endonuclease
MARPKEDPFERFMKKVEFTHTCWIWKGCIRTDSKNKGYGYFKWLDNKGSSAHRASYQLFRGAIPENLEIDHLCQNRSCVNPAHLEVVTHQENMDRRWKGRRERDKNEYDRYRQHSQPYHLHR